MLNFVQENVCCAENLSSKLWHNGLGLYVVVGLEPQKLNLLLMLNRITNVEIRTKATLRKALVSGSYFIIPLQIYPFDVMISIDESDDVLEKRLMKYGSTKEDCSELINLADTVRGRCVMLPSNQTVIRLKKLPKKYDMMSVISHEVFHATTFILHRIGMKLELFVSDEAYAYMIGFLTTEIYKKIKI